MDLKMPKGVLFDLDGTLLDSAPDFIASLDSLLTKYNQPKLDPEIIRSHVSDGSWKLTSLGFKIDISDHKCSILREELLDEYETNLLKYGRAFDGIKEMLLSLDQDNIPYGVVTNKPLRFAKPILMNEAAVNRGLFQTTLLHTEKDEDKKLHGDDEIRCKPDPSKTKGTKFGNYDKLII